MYHWAKQEKTKDCRIVECKEHHPIKNFKRDPTGFYVLIRPNFETYRLEAAVCNKKHQIVAIFTGRSAVDVYDEMFSYEKKYHSKWFQEKSHIAYLGKELKKAELALVSGNNSYYQD
jgi:hypothetical protein